MFLIFGLGNPEKKYEETRHNIGSKVVDELRSSPHFATARVIDELGSFDLADVILAKPATFMNESGKRVKSLIRYHALKANNLIVLHDDLDIPLGEIRIAKDRGSAGHKGVDSVIKEMGTKDFVRFRVGVCPKAGKPANPEKFVLQKFNKEEGKIVEQAIEKTAEAIEFLLKEGLKKTMTKYNN